MSQKDKINFLQNLDPKKLRLGLTGDQYFNLRQQMMNADVPAYQQAFPWSSGYRLGQIMENVVVPFPLKVGADVVGELAKPVYGGILELGEGALDMSGDVIENITKPVDWLAEEMTHQLLSKSSV